MTVRSPVRQRVMLIGIFALFFIPVLTAYVLRVFPDLIGDFNTSNHGEFIKPPISVERDIFRMVGQGQDDQPLDFDAHWTILTFSDGTCDRACVERLGAIANVQIAMHKDRERVRRVMVLPPGTAVPESVASDDALTIVRAKRQPLADLTGQPSPYTEAGVHLVDPRGFLFMRYTRGQSASDLLKDLKRLLRISKVG